MAAFTPINGNGSTFAMQLAQGEHSLDVFAVFGLPADGPPLDHRALRSHFRKTLMPHCFERQTASSAATQGPDVPTWQQANIAKEILFKLDAGQLVALQTAWSATSVQTWNPFAAPGAPEAFVPAAKDHVLPAHFYASVEEVQDEYDAARATAGAGSGTANDPFSFDSDDGDPGPSTPSNARPSTPPPFPFQSASSSSRPPTYAPMPGTPQKRRYDPRGLLLGTWKHAGLDAVRANAVYGSRDKLDRINRRISKESPTGQLATGGNFNNKKTACSHADIDYLPQYQGMTKEEVNSHIMPLLLAGGGAYVDVDHETETPSGRRGRASGVPTARFFPAGDGGFYDVNDTMMF